MFSPSFFIACVALNQIWHNQIFTKRCRQCIEQKNPGGGKLSRIYLFFIFLFFYAIDIYCGSCVIRPIALP